MRHHTARLAGRLLAVALPVALVAGLAPVSSAATKVPVPGKAAPRYSMNSTKPTTTIHGLKVKNAAKYRLQYFEKKGNKWVNSTTFKASSKGTYTFTFKNMTGYRIQALNSRGQAGAASDAVVLSTPIQKDGTQVAYSLAGNKAGSFFKGAAGYLTQAGVRCAANSAERKIIKSAETWGKKSGNFYGTTAAYTSEITRKMWDSLYTTACKEAASVAKFVEATARYAYSKKQAQPIRVSAYYHPRKGLAKEYCQVFMHSNASATEIRRGGLNKSKCAQQATRWL